MFYPSAFTFKATPVKKHVTSSPKPAPSYKIAKIEVIDGEYKAIINVSKDDKLEALIYPLTRNSYDLRHQPVWYDRTPDQYGHYTAIYRDAGQIIECSCSSNPIISNNYIPFRPNREVKGLIVIEDGIKKFDYKLPVEKKKDATIITT